MGQGFVKALLVKREDGYICRSGGNGIGTEFIVVKLDGKVYIYDRSYDFGNYSNDPDTIKFIKKYGVILK